MTRRLFCYEIFYHTCNFNYFCYLYCKHDPIFASHGETHHDEQQGQHGMTKNMMGNHHVAHNGMCAPGFASLDGMCILDDRCGPGAILVKFVPWMVL